MVITGYNMDWQGESANLQEGSLFGKIFGILFIPYDGHNTTPGLGTMWIKLY